MANNRKENERLILRYFFEKLPNPPKGRLVEDESPDFILQISRKYNIGIELTQIYKPSGKIIKKLPDLIPEINKAINNKLEKLPLYRRKSLNEYWLVITIENLNLPFDSNLQEKIDNSFSETKFHHIWLFDLFRGQLTEINPT